jgi:phosphoribosylanthranilate isomerase
LFMTISVKICGLRRPVHARAAAAAGADMLGLVFAPSRRRVSLGEARAIVDALQEADVRPYLVGLFVNESPAVINATVQDLGLDLVQLAGNESIDLAAAIQTPILKSVRLDGSEPEAAWFELARDAAPISEGWPDWRRVMLLVDAHVPGSYGGTGARADWDAAAELAQQLPIILAGGLHPENVGSAVQQVRPWGVDVSSGVETDGVKDVARIQAFVTAARSHD